MAKKKRLKKKQQKQKIEQKLIQKGYSKKEIKKIPEQEVKKVQRQISNNEKKKIRRQQNRNFIRKNNLTESYKYKGTDYKGSRLEDLSPDVLKEFARIQKRRDSDRKRQTRYKQKMIDGGLPEHLANKYKGESEKFVNEAIHKGDRTIYKAKESLSVLWSDVTGESHYDLALAEYNDLTTNEMITRINDLYHYMQTEGAQIGSPFFKGVAKIQTSSDRKKLIASAKDSYKRGYTKGAVGEDGHFLTSDKFTVRGYANMMLSVMTRAKPEHVQDYYAKFETYAFENLPEIHKQIF